MRFGALSEGLPMATKTLACDSRPCYNMARLEGRALYVTIRGAESVEHLLWQTGPKSLIASGDVLCSQRSADLQS